MCVEIGTKYGNFNASVSGTGRRNKTMDLGKLERWNRWGRVKIEENSGLRLRLLCNSHSMGDPW